MSRALVIVRADEYELITPYNKDFVDNLKHSIPSGCRSYDPDTRAWTVDECGHDEAIHLLRRYYGTVEFLESWDAGSPRAGAPAHHIVECVREVRTMFPDYAVLGLLPDATLQLVQACYRALARMHHPDRHGPASTQKMAAINAAYEHLSNSLR
jgi:hypothetical protein